MSAYVKLDDVREILYGCDWAFDEVADKLDVIYMIDELQRVEIMDAAIRDGRRFGRDKNEVEFTIEVANEEI